MLELCYNSIELSYLFIFLGDQFTMHLSTDHRVVRVIPTCGQGSSRRLLVVELVDFNPGFLRLLSGSSKLFIKPHDLSVAVFDLLLGLQQLFTWSISGETRTLLAFAVQFRVEFTDLTKFFVLPFDHVDKVRVVNTHLVDHSFLLLKSVLNQLKLLWVGKCILWPNDFF